MNNDTLPSYAQPFLDALRAGVKGESLSTLQRLRLRATARNHPDAFTSAAAFFEHERATMSEEDEIKERLTRMTLAQLDRVGAELACRTAALKLEAAKARGRDAKALELRAAETLAAYTLVQRETTHRS